MRNHSLDIYIFFWDTEENFILEETQVQLGIIEGKSKRFKDVFRYYNSREFIENLTKIESSSYLLIICHVDFKNSYTGFHQFEIFLEEFPEIRKNVIYVSSNKEAHKDFTDKLAPKISIHTYSEISEKLRAGTIFPWSKNDILKATSADITSNEITPGICIEDCHYAIMTALYEDEFEEIEKIFDFNEKCVRTGTYIYKIGKLKNTEIKVVACFAPKTGMVEASIIATEMINVFHPKYILMPGVCGGSEDTCFGSIIVAEKVFIFQKGKVSNHKSPNEDGVKDAKLLYDGNELDLNKITDMSGKQIKLIFEKFEPESENIEIDPEILALIKPHFRSIENKLNEPYADSEKIKVQMEPMACSMMVINKEDYFEDNILSIDRKTKAVEMESYGVARASKMANGGKTKFLIFKSVMDKTKSKTDGFKRKAAYTSAQFLKYLLENKILE